MTELLAGDCTRRWGVMRLIDWLNEIHCWGLTVHARHCERDIKISMKINSVGSGFLVS